MSAKSRVGVEKERERERGEEGGGEGTLSDTPDPLSIATRTNQAEVSHIRKERASEYRRGLAGGRRSESTRMDSRKRNRAREE